MRGRSGGFQGAVAAALLFGAVLGCAPRAIPKLPDSLEPGEGLLVARLYVLGLRAIENASIYIDGVYHPSAMVDGYIAIPLRPGEHKLSKVEAAGHLVSSRAIDQQSPYGGEGRAVPAGYYTQIIRYTTLTIDRSFRIERGKVTNLGLIVYMPVGDAPGAARAANNDSRSYNTATLDNGAEARFFLETNYPELMATLRSRDLFIRAPGNYLEADKLPKLRRAIAYHEQFGSNVLTSPDASVVYGRAGTIVVLTKNDKGGESPAVEILDTGTLADILGAVRHGERYSFVTSDAALLTWERGALTREPLPQRVHPVGLYAVGARGLMVIDNRMRILTARESGAPWMEYEGVMTRTPRRDLVVASDDHGAFIAVGAWDLPTAMYYIAEGEVAPKIVQAPAPALAGLAAPEGGYLMMARPTGLFMLYPSPMFLFRSNSLKRWAIRSWPQKDCKPNPPEADGLVMVVECGGTTYRSTDSGATWNISRT